MRYRWSRVVFRRSALPVSPGSGGLLALLALLTLGTAACDSILGSGDDGEEKEEAGTLLFVSDRMELPHWDDRVLQEVFRMEADGTGLENLGLTPAPSYGRPRFHPDGSRFLVESSLASDCTQIWVVDRDGLHATPVTGSQPAHGCNAAPRWSPDGERIAFNSSREPSEWSPSVWVMNGDGSGVVNVSRNTNPEVVHLVHGWSPNGRIVFHSWDSHWSSVTTYQVDPDGTEREPMFQTQGDHGPFWSPDGTKVVFVSQRDGNSEVYRMNADGSDVRNLTNHPAPDDLFGASVDTPVSPWSPDGGKIVFRSDRYGQGDLFVMNADGSSVLRLTDLPGSVVFQGWSPDGERIAFCSFGPGGQDNWDVFVKTLGTLEVVNVTDHPAEDRFAAWLPPPSGG